MYGIKTEKGWLCPILGYGRFFEFTPKEQYPFNTRAGAKAIAKDWIPEMKVEIIKRRDK